MKISALFPNPRGRAWMLLGVLLFFAGVGRAEPSDVERTAKAKFYYESGMAHFNLEEWDAAIAAWQEGYRVKPAPQFLYNLAQAYRKSNRPEKALQFYQRYLRLDPTTPQRAEIEDQIGKMTKLVEVQRQTASAPPDNALPPNGHASEPSAKTATDAPATDAHATAPVTPTADNVLTASPAPPPKKTTPVYKRWWLWTGVAAVAAAGVGVGLGLALSPHDAAIPKSSLGDASVHF